MAEKTKDPAVTPPAEKTITVNSTQRKVPANYVKVVQEYRGEGRYSGATFEQYRKPHIAEMMKKRIGDPGSGIISVGDE